MKRFSALLLALILVMSLSVSAFADNTPATGEITVSNATNGKTYNAYKIFDATYDENGNVAYSINSTSPWYSVLTSDAGKALFDLRQIDGSTDYAVVRKSGATDSAILDLFKAQFEYADDAWTCKVSGASADLTNTATADGAFTWSNVPYGYYFITSTLGSVVTVDTASPSVTVIDKNQTGDLAKFIKTGVDAQGNVIKEKVSETGIGEAVNYIIEITAPNYEGDEMVINYFVYDQMDAALSFNNDVAITVNGTAITNFNVVTAAADLSDEDDTFEINIPWVDKDGEFLYSEVNNKIVITYSATVNEAIEIGTAMENKAAFDNETVPPTSDDKTPLEEIPEIDPDKPWDETESYSAEIDVLKVDNSTPAKSLAGAKFSFNGTFTPVVIVSGEIFVEDNTNGTYYKLNDGTYTESTPVTADKMEAIDAATATAGYVVAEDDYTGDDVVVVNSVRYRALKTSEIGVAAEVYKLVKANADKYDGSTKYAKVTKVADPVEPQTITLEAWVDEDGELSFTGLGEGTYTLTELVAPDGYNPLEEPIEIEVTFDKDNKVFTYDCEYTGSEDVTATNGVISITVVNQSGTVLPSTGGIGTTIFYVIGSILLIGATILLITKKRMNG